MSCTSFRFRSFFLSVQTALFVTGVSVGMLVFAFTALETKAAVNEQISYQAKLLDSTGTPVSDSSYSMKFSLYDAASGGSRLWTASGTLVTPTAIPVTVTNGLFTVNFGDTSSTGGWQNDFSTVDWTRSDLYLGISIGSDSEMTPRRRLTSAPQAFNSERLQGMYASSSLTSAGGGSLFTIHQTTNDAAATDRTALTVQTKGTSSVYDFLVKGLNDLGTTVFSVNRAGVVSSTALFTVNATTTNLDVSGTLRVGGVLTCLADGTNCSGGGGGGGADTRWTYNGTDDFLRMTSTTTDFVLGSAVTSTAPFYFKIDGASESSNRLIVGGNQNADLLVGAATGSSSLFYPNGASIFGASNVVAGGYVSGQAFMTGSSLSSYAMFQPHQIYRTGTDEFKLTFASSTGSFLPNADGYTLGSASARWNGNFLDTTTTNATATNLYVSGRFSTVGTFAPDALDVTNATATNLDVKNRFSNTFNTSTPFSFVKQLGSVPSLTVARIGNRLYTGGLLSGVNVYDMTNPANPTLLTTFLSGSSIGTLEAMGDRLLVGMGDGFRIVDVSNPANLKMSPIFGSSGVLGGYPVGSTIYTNRNYDQYIYAFDHSVQTTPVQVKILPICDNSWYIQHAVVGSLSYYGCNDPADYMKIVDVSDPMRPVVVKTSTGISGIWRMAVSNNIIAATTGTASNSDLGISFMPANGSGALTVSSALYLPSSGGAGAAYVESLKFFGSYLFVGMNGNQNRIHIVDVRDITNPVLVRTIALDTGSWGNQTVYDMTLFGNYLVYTGGSNQILIYDLGGTRLGVAEAGYITAGGLFVQNKASFLQDVHIEGGLHTRGGLMTYGDLIVHATNTTSSIAGHLFVGGDLEMNNGDILLTGTLEASTSSVTSTAKFLNYSSDLFNTSWGVYTNRLLVGDNNAATGTTNYSGVVTYNGASITGGLCIDDTSTSAMCPTAGISNASILADDAVTVNAFDLAETYVFSGSVEPGDVLVLDPSTSSTVRQSTGQTYDPTIIGIVSTKPGFLLGWNEGAHVALAGRVPTKFSGMNGSVRVGDALTTSGIPGYAMKATKPGRIVGYALEDASTTSTIEVFVNVGYNAASVLQTDGTFATITDDLLVTPRATATALAQTQSSFGFTFRGSAWDGSQAITSDFRLANEVTSATSSMFTIRDGSDTALLTLSNTGSLAMASDLSIGGRLYLSGRGTPQSSTYMFLDTSASPTSTYIATNADGWQANDSYDFAERFYSPDALEPGDLVVVSERGRTHVQRSLNGTDMLVGIVSTKPAFVAGAPAPSTYPIALAGRVPTKVSTLNGSIKPGDPLAPSTVPGIAVKAMKAGPIVGMALESYDLSGVGKIEVNVNPTWWGGSEAPPVAAVVPTSTEPRTIRGFASIAAGSKRVHVSFPSLLTIPNIQAVPYGDTSGTWWIERVTDVGFDLVLTEALPRNILWSWTATAVGGGEYLYHSDGTYVRIDPTTGVAVPGTQATTTVEVTSPPAPAPIPSPTPVPESEPESVSEPDPEPAPEPDPTPAPAATPETTTSSTESTTPPASDPVVDPLSEPTPEPTPSPEAASSTSST